MHIYRINFLFLMLFATSNVFAAYYPTSSWEISSPVDQQVRTDNVDALVNLAFLDDSTQAVVVIKNGKIISEKYAEGYDKNSHGTSWSMAKSYYAALIGISIDRGEIGGLDDKVGDYLTYFNDERSEITIRDLLDMSSGLDFPKDEHETMFFQEDHLKYAMGVELKSQQGLNLNITMLIQCCLEIFLLLLMAKKLIYC